MNYDKFKNADKKGFVKSMASWAADGFKTSEKAEARWDICKKCYLLDTSDNTCLACGCIMKLKVKIEKAKCPEGHW